MKFLNCKKDKPTAKEMYEKGGDCFNKGDLNGAITYYDKAIETDASWRQSKIGVSTQFVITKDFKHL